MVNTPETITMAPWALSMRRLVGDIMPGSDARKVAKMKIALMTPAAEHDG